MTSHSVPYRFMNNTTTTTTAKNNQKWRSGCVTGTATFVTATASKPAATTAPIATPCRQSSIPFIAGNLRQGARHSGFLQDSSRIASELPGAGFSINTETSRLTVMKSRFNLYQSGLQIASRLHPGRMKSSREKHVE